MSNAAISVEKISKKYLVGHASQSENYLSVRESLGRGVRNLGRKLADVIRARQIIQGDQIEEFWALKDVSFEVGEGEIVGVIGRNGAGKSTLLKILSRITEPTSGHISIRGRVASLLEVGTGFHPELSGRENIFLNGAILGMTKREIRKKFDDIVGFAEVERFLDTPVKRYSSGMYVRLAFAVAAHLDPEILLVDEVLAVGDAAFQKRCLGKIEAVSSQEGRTVIFISHNTNALLSLCKRGILLERGRVAFVGSMPDVVGQYFFNNALQTSVEFVPHEDRPSITRVAVDEEALKVGDLVLDIGFTSPFPLDPPLPEIIISSSYGIPVFGSNGSIHSCSYSGVPAKSGTMHFEARNVPLVSGFYTVTVWLGDGERPYDGRHEALIFEFKARREHGEIIPEKSGHLQWPAKWVLT